MKSPGNNINVRCSRCLIPQTYPGVVFDDNGVCNQCLAFKKQVLLGKNALLKKLETQKGIAYDCVIGISGGKDSCYVAYLAKKEFGLKALAVCYDFPFLVDLAKDNIRRVTDSLGMDLIVINSKGHLEYDLVRNHFSSLASTGTTWGQCMFCHYGIDAVLYNVAIEKNIPFILSGITQNELWNPGSRTKFLLNRVKKLPLNEICECIYYQSKAYINLFRQRRQFPIQGNSCFNVYKKAKLPQQGPEVVHVFDYMHWDQNLIEKTLKEQTGWVRPKGETSWRYDCMLEPLLDYTYMREFGISCTGIYLSGLIRSGLMSRDKGLKTLETKESEVVLRKALLNVLSFLNVSAKTKIKFLKNHREWAMLQLEN